MVSIQQYQSPLGGILLAADEVGLVGLWFEGQKYFANTLPVGHCAQTTPILAEAKRWLDIYFAGKEPDFLPTLPPSKAINLPITLLFFLLEQVIGGHYQFFDGNHNIRITVFAEFKSSGIFTTAHTDALHSPLSLRSFFILHLHLPSPHIPIFLFLILRNLSVCSPAPSDTIHIADWF